MFNKLTQQVRQSCSARGRSWGPVFMEKKRRTCCSQPWTLICLYSLQFVKTVLIFRFSQHLKFPRCLVFVIQTVRVEIELPRGGCLVLIVQTVCSSGEAEPRRSVRRRGEGGRRAQVARYPVAAHWAHGGTRRG